VAKHVPINGSTFVTVLNHDPKFDLPALTLALANGARYVGAIGSRRTRQMHLDRLRAQGVAEAELARVHGPIGLDIGARSPEEIAVSILAELIAERYGRPGGMLSRSLPDHAAAAVSHPAGDAAAPLTPACPQWITAEPAAAGPR